MSEPEVVWHGGLHRQILPDAEILANRARARSPQRPTPQYLTSLSVSSQSRRLILAALGPIPATVATIAQRAHRCDKTAKLWLDRLVAAGLVDRTTAPLPNGVGGNAMTLYRLPHKVQRVHPLPARPARGSGTSPIPGMDALSEQGTR